VPEALERVCRSTQTEVEQRQRVRGLRRRQAKAVHRRSLECLRRVSAAISLATLNRGDEGEQRQEVARRALLAGVPREAKACGCVGGGPGVSAGPCLGGREHLEGDRQRADRAKRAQARRRADGEHLLGGDVPEILRSQAGKEQDARIIGRLRKGDRTAQQLRAARRVGFQHAAHPGEQGRREFDFAPVRLQKRR
jgi:hypothetical protein